jgi:hypothetical protein
MTLDEILEKDVDDLVMGLFYFGGIGMPLFATLFLIFA